MDTYLLEQLRTITSNRGSFSGSASKISKKFKSTNEQMLLTYIVHTVILKRSSHK